MLVIAICGKRGSGKSTLERAISDLYPYKMYYQHAAFAAPLKEAISLLFGYSMADLDDQNFKSKEDDRYGCTPRIIMQKLGTEFFRDKISEDFWVNHMENTLETAKASHVKLCIVTDVRFQNEADLLKKYNAFFVKIDSSTEVKDFHESETQTIDAPWDMVIHNDGKDLDLIKEAASEILENFKDSLTPPEFF